jgi:uncharacterized alkaline shock family protein YloU
VGRNELGVVTIDDSVVSKIAARAASEIPDAGAAAPRVLGKSLPGAGSLGTRATSLDELPKASAEVDGSVVFIELSISVRWPCSVPAVAQSVRQRVSDRVTELTGLHVAEVTIEVADLVTQLAPPSRVH